LLALAPPAWAANATTPDPPAYKSFGTGGGNIEIGRDPQTGDSFMRTGPVPQTGEPEYEVPAVEVRPEISWPAPRGNGRPARDGSRPHDPRQRPGQERPGKP
jgi:hypothetical protein